MADHNTPHLHCPRCPGKGPRLRLDLDRALVCPACGYVVIQADLAILEGLRGWSGSITFEPPADVDWSAMLEAVRRSLGLAKNNDQTSPPQLNDDDATPESGDGRD